MDPNIILLISFIIFMALAFRYGYKKSIATLDTQISEIKNTLDTAARKKEEALVMLSEQRQAYSEALNFAETLEVQNQEKLRALKKTFMHDLEQLVRKKESDYQDLTKRFSQEAILEIQREVGQITQLAVQQYAEKVMTDKDREKLMNAAIDEVIMTFNIMSGHTSDVPIIRQRKKPITDFGVVS